MDKQEPGKVEAQKQPDTAKQPVVSQEKPVGSQEKPDTQGMIVGLKKQLQREKDRNSDLEKRIVSLESSLPSSEEESLGWKTEDDAEKRQKELVSLQRKYKDATEARQKAERRIQLLEFSQKHGIPYEVLSDAKTELELAERVAQWNADKKAEEEPKKETPASGQFEIGSGKVSPSKPIFGMSVAEFDEYDKKVKAEARARKLK